MVCAKFCHLDHDVRYVKKSSMSCDCQELNLDLCLSLTTSREIKNFAYSESAAIYMDKYGILPNKPEILILRRNVNKETKDMKKKLKDVMGY